MLATGAAGLWRNSPQWNRPAFCPGPLRRLLPGDLRPGPCLAGRAITANLRAARSMGRHVGKTQVGACSNEDGVVRAHRPGAGAALLAEHTVGETARRSRVVGAS